MSSPLHDDEYMIVRKRDGAEIVSRLFLTDTGCADNPVSAIHENKQIARSLNNALACEKSGWVSFGKI